MVPRGKLILAFVLSALSGLFVSPGSAEARKVEFRSLQDSLVRYAVERYVPVQKYHYDWKDAVLMKSLADVYDTDRSKRKTISAYIAEVASRTAEIANGKHPNAVASGVGYAFLQRIGLSTSASDSAATVIYNDYRQAIRSAEGGVSHRSTHLELWDDTLYMTGIFLVQMYRATGDLKYLHDLANEFTAHAKYLRDPATGMWYHGWAPDRTYHKDWCCQPGWNDNPDQRNHDFWGRGNGWIAMVLVDLLEYLPRKDAARPELEGYLLDMVRTLEMSRDAASRHWRQLPVRVDDEGNFLESSCTAMFAYAIAKAARLGLIEREYRAYAAESYKALVNMSLENRGTPELTLGRICAGTCIGDPQYYYARKIVSGETYAIGALIMLGVELKRR